MTALLEARRLTAHYGDFQALFGIDFAVDEGETIAIVGANGAGKSSFLCSIAGVVPVEKSAVVFCGQDIGGLPVNRIVALGVTLVPEGRRLFSGLTVEENLMMGAYCGRKGEWDLAQVYRLFPQLREARNRPATSMSGGEQQMVAIGRALMSNPRLLMCDELSLGLAPKVVGAIYATLAEVKQRGVTLIIVEQSVRQAMSVADRVYCFRSGHVSLKGNPKEISDGEMFGAYF
jgi:branched-chain amino acid transport system ATP-binding protein